MTLSLGWQYAAVFALLALSLVQVLRKLAPRRFSRWQTRAADRLNRPGRSAVLRALGRRLRPEADGGACGSGCGTCGSCGPEPQRTARQDAQPLEFHARRR